MPSMSRTLLLSNLPTASIARSLARLLAWSVAVFLDHWSVDPCLTHFQLFSRSLYKVLKVGIPFIRLMQNSTNRFNRERQQKTQKKNQAERKSKERKKKEKKREEVEGWMEEVRQFSKLLLIGRADENMAKISIIRDFFYSSFFSIFFSFFSCSPRRRVKGRYRSKLRDHHQSSSHGGGKMGHEMRPAAQTIIILGMELALEHSEDGSDPIMLGKYGVFRRTMKISLQHWETLEFGQNHTGRGECSRHERQMYEIQQKPISTVLAWPVINEQDQNRTVESGPDRIKQAEPDLLKTRE